MKKYSVGRCIPMVTSAWENFVDNQAQIIQTTVTQRTLQPSIRVLSISWIWVAYKERLPDRVRPIPQ